MSSNMHQKLVDVRTPGRGLHDVTNLVRSVVTDSHVRVGMCSLFLQHTSASLVIQENADPAVLRDLERWLGRLAPEGGHYEHNDEGPDDMPAHLRAAVTNTSLLVPIMAGNLALGTWQGIYVWEHRTNPHHRRIVVTTWGDKGGV